MKPLPSLLCASVCVALAPVSVSACDLDGLPGFHRFNPFLNESKNRWPVRSVPAATESFEPREIALTETVEQPDIELREEEQPIADEQSGNLASGAADGAAGAALATSETEADAAKDDQSKI